MYPIWKPELYSIVGTALLRVAPLGIFYGTSDDFDIIQKVKNVIWCTHTNPLTTEACFLFVKALSAVLHTKPEEFQPTALLDYLIYHADFPIVKRRLSSIKNDIQNLPIREVTNWSDYLQSQDWQRVLMSCLSGGSITNLDAVDCLCISLFYLCIFYKNPKDIILACIHTGGDTHATAKIGAELAFALHGRSHIPQEWFDSFCQEDLEEVNRTANKLLSLL